MGQVIVIVVLLAVQILMFLYFRMMIRNELSRENRIDEVRREIEQLIIELDRTTDRNVELVEHRIGQLKESISEGQKVIRLIESESEKRDNAPSLYTELKPLQRGGESFTPPAEEVIATGSPDNLEIENIDIEVVDGRERALELFRQGLDSAHIAASTGLPRGEVELIISLHEKG